MSFWVAGGRGDMSNASNDNGGGYNGPPDAAVYTDFQDSNGGPSSDVSTFDGSQTACTVTNNGGVLRITGPEGGEFANCTVGSIANIKYSGTYSDGRVIITSVDGSGDFVGIGTAYSADVTCDIHVGGAFAADGSGIQAALDLAVAGDTIKITTDVSSATSYNVGTQIDIDGNVGTFDARITVHGVNLVDGVECDLTQARPILIATANMTAVMHISGATTFYRIRSIDHDGGGAGNGDRGFSIGDINSQQNEIWNCRMHNADEYGTLFSGRYNLFISCEMDNNRGRGLAPGSLFNRVIGCSIHNNVNQGIRANFECLYFGNIIYDNNGDDIFCENTSDNAMFINNTVEGGNADGIGIEDNTTIGLLFVNNTSCNHATAGKYGYDFRGGSEIGNTIYFGFNHANGNQAGNASIAVSDGDFAVLGFGNNQTGDPLFADVSGNDYRPGAGSALLNTGSFGNYPKDGDTDALESNVVIGAMQDVIAIGGSSLHAIESGII